MQPPYKFILINPRCLKTGHKTSASNQPDTKSAYCAYFCCIEQAGLPPILHHETTASANIRTSPFYPQLIHFNLHKIRHHATIPVCQNQLAHIMLSSCHTVEPIGFIQSPYKQKFGVARQPGLVPAAEVALPLLPAYTADCVRGLAEFDYVWLQFVFHAVLDEGWSPLVRPPRLGGKRKMGVFATRSPHRPNHLGLSLLKLERIEVDKQICLYLSGADLLDGTPVLDIKPYIPFVEAKPTARSGFVGGPPPLLSVCWLPEAEQAFQAASLGADFRLLLEQSIAQDPRPAYQNSQGRVYVMYLAATDVYFRVDGQTAWIVDLKPHLAKPLLINTDI